MKILYWFFGIVVFIIVSYYILVLGSFLLNPVFSTKFECEKKFDFVQQKVLDVLKLDNDALLKNASFVDIDNDSILNGLIHDPQKTFKIIDYTPEYYLHFELQTLYAIAYGWEKVDVKISRKHSNKTKIEIDYSEFGFIPFWPPFVVYNPGFIRERKIKDRFKNVILRQ